MQVYVFQDADWDKTLELIDTTSEYGLTGSM
jgi:1-pyrroline-5-carboxylate dehydrogenase